jgi:hypothetical protein
MDLIAVVATHDYIEPTLKSMGRTIANFHKFKNVRIVCPTSGIKHNFEEINVAFDYANYSKFMLHELHRFVTSEHCITIQYDSCIINPSLWTDEFLEYDYIGAPWLNQWANRVGNGGFSLRSKKFLDATKILPYAGNHYIKEFNSEDFYACVLQYQTMLQLDIKFPRIELAKRFSTEHPIPECPHKYDDLSTYNSFGFHGEFNKAGMEYIWNS